jgi:YbbR domain-containing protein
LKNILTNFKNNFGKASVNKKLYVFLVCLFLSSFYWFLNSLAHTHSTNLDIDITYNKNLEKHIILNELPNVLKIKITGVGYYLLGYKLGWRNPEIDIDLSMYVDKDLKDNSNLDFESFIPSIENQLGNKIQITSIYPKKVKVDVDEIMEKSIKIKPQTYLTFSNQFQLSDIIKATPSHVNVIGPKSVLDTLNHLPTELKKILNIEASQNIQAGFDIDFLNKLKLTTDLDKINLSIPVDKFTEYKMKVPINTVNIPENMSISIFPNYVDVKFMISLAKLSDVKETDFEAIVDCKELNNQYRKLKVDLSKYPSFIKSVSLKPAKVEYVLKKRND